MPEATPLTEAGTVTLTETEGTGTALVTLITPGQGSSGEYPAEVLESAAADGVFAAGTHMYLDHPTPGERPERSLDRLAGVLTEAATWDGEALRAPAKIYPRFRQMLAEMQDAIGVSIRAGGVIESGIVKSIGPVASVDFVTKPGRGGSFQLVESAVLVEGHGMTANDLSQALSDAVRDTYGAEQTYTWVRDYTDEWVVFSVETPDSCDLWRQSYTVADREVTLTGDKVEVDAVTTYVPSAGENPTDTAPGGMSESLATGGTVTTTITDGEVVLSPLRLQLDAGVIWNSLQRLKKQGGGHLMFEAEATPIHDAIASTLTPADLAGQPASSSLPAPTTEESQEDTMPDLTEAEVQSLRESADQLPTVTAERDEARDELRAYRRRDAARPIIEAGLTESDLPARIRARLTESVLADLPTTADGALDEDALKTRLGEAIEAAKAELTEALAAVGGATGQVHGLGTGTATVEESAPSAEYAAIYGTGA